MRRLGALFIGIFLGALAIGPVAAVPPTRGLSPSASSLPSGIAATKIADGSVSNTEFQRLDGVVSGIQGQIDGKAASSHNHGAGDITAGTLDAARLPTIIRGLVVAAGSGSVTSGFKYLTGTGGALSGGFVSVFYAAGDLNANNLTCSATTAPGGTETATFTVMVSTDHGSTFSDSVLACPMSGTGKTCDSGSTNLPLSTGDRLAIKATGSASTAAADVVCTFRVNN